MNNITLNNLTKDYMFENMKEVTEEECWGNTLHQFITLFGEFTLGKFNLIVGYRPHLEKPWSISGGVGNFKTYKNFTGLKNYIKKTNQFI